MYAGKTLAEIAGLNVYQIRDVICRKRDSGGKLLRHDPDLPDHVRDTMDATTGRRVVKGQGRSYKEMFRQAKLSQGMDTEQAEAAWSDYLERHPRHADRLAGRKRKQARAKKKQR